MPAPITFTDVSSIGDVLSHDRHALYFPQIPGGANGDGLMLRNTTVQLPQADVGQIIAKPFGWAVAFAGRRAQVNTFSASFIETVDGFALKTLYAWQEKAAGFKSVLGSPKSEYAIDAKLVAKDTTGAYALVCQLRNVWPKTVSMAAFEESSGPMEHQVEFSIDAVDLLDIAVVSDSLEDRVINDYSSNLGSVSGTRGGGYTASSGGGIRASSGTVAIDFFGGFNLSQMLAAKISGSADILQNVPGLSNLTNSLPDVSKVATVMPTVNNILTRFF